MVDLYLLDDDTHLGAISPEALIFLIRNLQEEDTEDTDYYIDRETIEFLRDASSPEGLLEVLEAALGDQEGIEIYYVMPEE